MNSTEGRKIVADMQKRNDLLGFFYFSRVEGQFATLNLQSLWFSIRHYEIISLFNIKIVDSDHFMYIYFKIMF